MKIPFFAAGLLAISVTAGFAADLPARPYTKAPIAPPAYNWTGCYAGANAGAVWGRQNVTSTATGPAWLVDAPADVAATNAVASPNIRESNGEAGGQIGCNWQKSSWVFGFEADAEYMGQSRSSSSTVIVPVALTSVTANTSTSSNYLSTVRGRLGFTPADRWLAYVTGGLAVGRVGLSQSIFFAGSGSTASGSTGSTQTGWVVGAGLEYGLTPNWSMRGEYLYVDLGSVSANLFNPAFPTFTHTTSAKFTDNIARVGLNYRWGGL